MNQSVSTPVKTLREKNKVRWIAVTALFMALNIIVSSFGGFSCLIIIY